MLRFVESLSFGEIARLQGKDVESVKSLFRRAILSLKKETGNIKSFGESE
jgi:DNA-directed RNA polymerase specialized sigma24 family protein